MATIVIDGHPVLIDDEDVDRVSKHSWVVRHRGRASYVVPKSMKMAMAKTGHSALHRFILSAEKGTIVDHKNRNGLDNRRENLRICSLNENAANRRSPLRSKSGFKGVTYHKQSGKWQGAIKINGKHVHLGLFDSAEDAAKAYDARAHEAHGEFACLNFTNEIGAQR